MEINKVTLMEAYMIETLRSKGMSNIELVTELEQKNTNSLKSMDPNYDYTDLITLYERDKKAFTSILTDGYEVKFVTMGGLKGLLELKFGKIATRDYTLTDKGMEHLEIEAEDLQVLNQFLSKNWTIQEAPVKSESANTKQISITLI